MTQSPQKELEMLRHVKWTLSLALIALAQSGRD